MSDNPSIVEIKTLEKELHLLLAQQEQGSIEQPPSPSALIAMQEANAKIIGLISTIQNKIAIVYPKGITNQNVVRSNNANLVDIVNKLHKEQKKIQQLLNKNDSLDGKNSNLTLQLNSSYYEYTFYLILTIVFGIYIFKIYGAFSGYDSVDTIILICAILLLVYNFIGPVMSYGKEGIQHVVRRIMELVYML